MADINLEVLEAESAGKSRTILILEKRVKELYSQVTDRGDKMRVLREPLAGMAQEITTLKAENVALQHELDAKTEQMNTDIG